MPGCRRWFGFSVNETGRAMACPINKAVVADLKSIYERSAFIGYFEVFRL